MRYHFTENLGKNTATTDTEYLVKYFTVLTDYSAVTALIKCAKANYHVGQLKDILNTTMFNFILCKI